MAGGGLRAAGVGTDGLVEDAARPTTEKVRVVTERNQQVARIDYERDTDVSGEVERAIIAQVTRRGGAAKALLVSDYLKGTVTRAVVEALLGGAKASAGKSTPLIVDPKIPHLACYAGATLVTPNHHEAEIATHMRVRTDDEARQAARDFRTRAQCGAVLITRGEHGMWLSDAQVDGSIPAVAREVSDVTGAGDTVVATLALALAAGATLTEAAALANRAAGIVVGKFGPATVTAQELLASLKGEVWSAKSEVRKLRTSHFALRTSQFALRTSVARQVRVGDDRADDYAEQRPAPCLVLRLASLVRGSPLAVRRQL